MTVIARFPDYARTDTDHLYRADAKYTYSPDWLGIYWPADEHVFIKLTVEKNIEKFYEEASDLILSLIKERNLDVPDLVMEDAIRINKNLISQPFVSDIIRCKLTYNVIDFWNKVRQGIPASIKEEPTEIIIDRSQRSYEKLDEWCREVVWWGNKKGAYLYNGEVASEQLAGHF